MMNCHRNSQRFRQKTGQKTGQKTDRSPNQGIGRRVDCQENLLATDGSTKNGRWKQHTFFAASLLCLVSTGIFTSSYFFELNDHKRATAAVSPVQSKQITSPKGLGWLKNWGLFNDKGSDIDVENAWKLSEGSRNVVVAIIDTGIDSKHKDLRTNLWSGNGTQNIPTRNISNAQLASVGLTKIPTPLTRLGKNLKKQFVFGWDFVSNGPNPGDSHGHGTHVAGIIGAINNEKEGVSGVVRKVSIMPVRYYSEENTGAVNLKNTIKAMNYAIENGAKIINYSGGGPEYSQEEYLAIKKAEAKGILIIAAAGNEKSDTDQVENYYYPSAYRTSNIISVAAINIQNKLLSSSNWGKKTVDVVAPGENIYSTLPGNKYGYMSGTSQATAFVSGIAALLLSENPSLTPVQIKEIISNSVDLLPNLASKVKSGGKVNAYRALLKLRELKGHPKESPNKKPKVKPEKFNSVVAVFDPVGDFLNFSETVAP